MKQFGKILKFELKGYMRNKVFVGITIFLVVAIAVVMFIPNIIAAFESDDVGDTTPADLPTMLVYAEDENLSAIVKEYFGNAFVDYIKVLRTFPKSATSNPSRCIPVSILIWDLILIWSREKLFAVCRSQSFSARQKALITV